MSTLELLGAWAQLPNEVLARDWLKPKEDIWDELLKDEPHV